jgi:aspartyl-tRNA(Asn)/glutamyl-tRNA(Gln) amidotransferase subunit A
MAGQVCAADIVAGYLARIKAHNSRLNAFVDVYEDDALAAAEAADKARRSGHALGPLHGIPIALKDLIDIDARVTTGGSAALRGRRSEKTATLVRRLVAQGLIILGKTHTVEFAMGGWGTNQHLGTPWNPWDLKIQRTPGGSSSGSGVAVAAGLSPWAIGTDTGGSVRLPASWCGLTGLKTTIGRVSTHGILALSPTLDTPGPLTHTVEDAALLYTVMQGADPHDPRTGCVPYVDPVPHLKREIRGLRLAILPGAERENVSKEVLDFYDQSVDELARLGAEVKPFVLPRTLSEFGSLNGKIMAAEGYSLYAKLLDDPNSPLDEDVRPRLLAGKNISSHEYLAALRMREELKAEFDIAFGNFSALVTPTTATAAVPLADVDQKTTPALFTRFVNLLDLCALAVPNGITAHGLPTSLQIVCRFGDEAAALGIGSAYQRATRWHQCYPTGY